MVFYVFKTVSINLILMKLLPSLFEQILCYIIIWTDAELEQSSYGTRPNLELPYYIALFLILRTLVLAFPGQLSIHCMLLIRIHGHVVVYIRWSGNHIACQQLIFRERWHWINRSLHDNNFMWNTSFIPLRFLVLFLQSYLCRHLLNSAAMPTH